LITTLGHKEYLLVHCYERQVGNKYFYIVGSLRLKTIEDAACVPIRSF